MRIFKQSKKFLQIRTVDNQSNDLRQNEAIGTLESGDLAERVDLGVLSRLVERGSRVGLSLDQLNIQVVALSSDLDGDGTAVFLCMKRVSVIQRKHQRK